MKKAKSIWAWCGARRFPRLEDAGLLVLRIWLGFGMLALHGSGKLLKLQSGNFAFPDPLGVGPFVSLSLAVFAEVLCAAFLALGLLTRAVAVPLVVTMSVAFFSVHGGVLKGEGNGELAFVYLAGFVALFFTGPGRYSLDNTLRKSKGD
ncbi:MAG: DoxX family protein [Acidobacteria bacterium]|nr:DoxX family protein [Acidobacteriota bacterium]